MKNESPGNGASVSPAGDSVERQLERSSFFTHTALGVQAERINEVESFLYGVIDVLVRKGVVIPDELTRAAEDVRKEMYEKGEQAHTGVGIRIDEPGKNMELVPVNCEERMHICQAVCCKLSFPLSVEEIETGMMKWDLGKPYFIRHESTGYCSHLHAKKKCCTVYENRPPVCKNYSCTGDKRIWKDFEKMELNSEWIAENLKENGPRLVTALMHVPVLVSDKT